MAWEGEDGPAVDTQIVRAGREPEVVVAEVDLDALRAWRAAETQGDAYRKPAAYAPLLDAPIAEVVAAGRRALGPAGP